MGHTKIIQAGNQIELYTYERDLPPKSYKRAKKPRNLYNFISIIKRKDNVQRQKTAFVRLVRANIERESVPTFLTLTMREIRSDTHSHDIFQKFITKIRYRLGKTFRYIAVSEVQKRGAIHFHVLLWEAEKKGIKACLVSKEYYNDKTGKKKRKHICPRGSGCERETRFLANLWGEGFADLFQTDNSPKIAGYLGKYLSKALLDHRYSGKKGYSASRNIKRPVLLPSTVLAYSQDIWGIELSTEANTLLSRSYQTQWLGRCDYKQIEINLD